MQRRVNISENFQKALEKRGLRRSKGETIHLNYVNKAGRIYCRKFNSLQFLENLDCAECPMFLGTIQGNGVECSWIDRDYKELESIEIFNPKDEYDRLNKI